MMNRRPNVVLLVLDTHRVDRMSVYGYGRRTTPVIDAFAGRSTVFDWAISTAQWTIPSHASMFTGLYPSEHQTHQHHSILPGCIPTLAELLRSHGYDTIGLCNNIIVGGLDNDFRRGFNQFYLYGGTVPDRPTIGYEVKGLRRAQRAIARVLQKISTAIEREFGRSPLLLKLSLMPFFVLLWGRMLNVKGDIDRSMSDAVAYFRYCRATNPERPLFVFINTMETHWPYHPPHQYVDKWVPYLRRERATREFVQRIMLESFRWVVPSVDPLEDWQQRVLHDLYDAEVAYQDKQLRKLFRYLRRSGELDNTMVIVTSDHGESHGEHGLMGHNFGAYGQLIHVPLIIHYPAGFPVGERISEPVSLRRIFHTILEAAGIPFEQFGREVADLSLMRTVEGKDPEDEWVVSEAYAPMNIVDWAETNNPESFRHFHLPATRRAIYGDGCKLLTIDAHPDAFFDVSNDPSETINVLDNPIGHERDVLQLTNRLEAFAAAAEARGDGFAAGQRDALEDSPEVVERLRMLGYLE